MKNLILIVILFLKVSNGYTQTYNPYDEFGYTIKNEYVRTNIESGIYLTNEDTSAKVKSIVIGSRSKKIYVLDKKDSIVESYDIPESALTKFLSVDPITKKYPELTPYQFASNSPIIGVDQDGLELYITTKGELLGSFGNSTQLRIVTDINVQNQIKVAASSNRAKEPADYPSYHTTLTTLNATQKMLTRAVNTPFAEGYATIVDHKDNVISGASAPAHLSVDPVTKDSYMMTPELIPSFNNKDEAHDEDVTFIHSHVIGAYSYNTISNKFLQLPMGADIVSTGLFNNSTNVAYNVQDPLTPSPADVSHEYNSRNYNWILVGNLNVININNNILTPGTPGAVFYQGNISNEKFRLSSTELKGLIEKAEEHVAMKNLSNVSAKP